LNKKKDSILTGHVICVVEAEWILFKHNYTYGEIIYDRLVSNNIV
jgi:hypothetical protein